ncbi:EAL domain, c-di-GMP-specific phosphodiesterase class I (or its enzymatically inactive variant) [Butyrivibrio sp. INlla18]|nr:EAL domain, c-di-GMP-specific phosphodiesterase class I (or its enzymatically inactive variant) [Butyrivibrio sp. INlla18]
MRYNIYFDICAMCILITIALTSLSRRRVPAYRQRAFALLFTTVFLSTAFERVETYLQLFPIDAPWYNLLEMLMGSLFFFVHLGSAFAYLFYIMSVLDIYYPLRSLKGFLVLRLGYAIGLLVLIINFFTPILFYYSSDGAYHRGKFLAVFYIIASYYIFYGVVLIFKYRHLMRLKTAVIITSYILLVFAGIIMQYLYPTFLIENFFNTISITFIFITLQNPSEMVDETLNILNRKAFMEGLDLKTKRNSKHNTIFVTIDNVRAISSEIGYMKGLGVLKKIAKYLTNVGFKELGLTTYTYRYSEYVFAITVHSEDEAKVKALMYKISYRLHEPWRHDGMAIRVSGHCFLMSYPKHYFSSAELITKVDLVTEDIAVIHSPVFDIDTINFIQLKKERDYDNLARDNLEAKKIVIKFQPFLSKIYKINYNADVLGFLRDEVGNEIDMRGRIPERTVTQTLMDANEYVFRHACRALAFWNAGDKNGKYRAVVGMSQGEISKTDFIKRVKRILREEKADGSWVSIKLTETTLTTMNPIAERNIKMLKDIGCYIIVDKFGSGYGDLEKILSLPVMQVNIGSSVLRSAAESEDMKKVAQGIVNLFHDISIFVCATDILTKEDLEMAESLGCDYLIGDYLCAPIKDSSYVNFIDAYFDEG